MGVEAVKHPPKVTISGLDYDESRAGQRNPDRENEEELPRANDDGRREKLLGEERKEEEETLKRRRGRENKMKQDQGGDRVFRPQFTWEGHKVEQKKLYAGKKKMLGLQRQKNCLWENS